MNTLKFCAFLLLLNTHIAVQASAVVTQIYPAGKNPRLHETLELGFQIPEIENRILQKNTHRSRALNPFDPNDIQISAQFIKGNKTISCSGFYFQPCKADEKKNQYLQEETTMPWRVRIALPDTGEWICHISYSVEKANAVQLEQVRLKCIPSEKHGRLVIARNNLFLEHQDGTPFFAIGQNVAWADLAQLRGYSPFQPVYNAGYYDIYHYINNIAENGGNYVRIVLVDWSMNIEWEKAGEYNQMRCAVLDSIFSIAEARDVKIHLTLTMMVHPEDQWGWKNHPYRKLAPAMANQSFMLTDPICRQLEKNRFRYIFNRWGYSPQLAAVELISEQDIWQGYSHDIFFPWMKDMVSFIRSELHSDVLISTSFAKEITRHVFSKDEMQFTSRHSYHNEMYTNKRRYQELYGSKGLLKIWNKPAIFGEMGITTGPRNGCDPDDVSYCSDITFHNDLWATAFMGTYGAGLNWWQWKNDSYRKNNFPALAAFVQATDYAITQLTACEYSDNSRTELFYKRDKNSKSYAAIGWVHNKTYWWGNMLSACKDRSGRSMPLPKDNDKAELPVDYTDTYFTIKGLKSRTTYTVTIYSTRDAGRIIATRNITSDIRGRLKIQMHENADAAFAVRKLVK
ncbi:MAG: hypothetical protein Fur0041_09340 [Bacteroidia bacterium]